MFIVVLSPGPNCQNMPTLLNNTESGVITKTIISERDNELSSTAFLSTLRNTQILFDIFG